MLNLALTWLQPQILVMRKNVWEGDIYEVVEIEPVAVWLQKKFPEDDNSKIQLLRADVEENFIPCSEHGRPLEKSELSPSIQYIYQHLYQSIKEVTKDAVLIEFLKKSSNEFGLQASLDDKFEQLIEQAMEPVLEYLISCCDWDKYLAQSVNLD